MPSNFPTYVRVSSSVSFVASNDEIAIKSSENDTDRFPIVFHGNCQLMFYSVYFNSCFFFKNNNRAFYSTFCWRKSFVGKWLLLLISYLYGLNSAKLLNCYFFFDDINFFRCLLWRYSGLIFKNALIF